MCDLLAISAGHNYTAQKYLPIFAEKAKQHINGWGIGFFRDGDALVEKSSSLLWRPGTRKLPKAGAGHRQSDHYLPHKLSFEWWAAQCSQ